MDKLRSFKSNPSLAELKYFGSYNIICESFLFMNEDISKNITVFFFFLYGSVF